jgi:hypothetical protein
MENLPKSGKINMRFLSAKDKVAVISFFNENGFECLKKYSGKGHNYVAWMNTRYWGCRTSEKEYLHISKLLNDD